MAGTDPSDLILFAAVVLLGLNQLIPRLTGWHRRRWVIGVLFVANLLAALWFLLVGLPSLRGAARYVNYVMGLLFIWHNVKNNSRYVSAVQADREEAAESLEDRKQQVHRALERAGTEIGPDEVTEQVNEPPKKDAEPTWEETPVDTWEEDGA